MLGLLCNAAAAYEEIVLAPGAVYVREAGPLHCLHLAVEPEGAYVIAGYEVPARC